MSFSADHSFSPLQLPLEIIRKLGSVGIESIEDLRNLVGSDLFRTSRLTNIEHKIITEEMRRNGIRASREVVLENRKSKGESGSDVGGLSSELHLFAETLEQLSIAAARNSELKRERIQSVLLELDEEDSRLSEIVASLAKVVETLIERDDCLSQERKRLTTLTEKALADREEVERERTKLEEHVEASEQELFQTRKQLELEKAMLGEETELLAQAAEKFNAIVERFKTEKKNPIAENYESIHTRDSGLDRSISFLMLNPDIKSRLKGARISTIRDLLSYTQDDLVRILRLSTLDRQYLLEKLAAFNLQLPKNSARTLETEQPSSAKLRIQVLIDKALINIESMENAPDPDPNDLEPSPPSSFDENAFANDEFSFLEDSAEIALNIPLESWMKLLEWCKTESGMDTERVEFIRRLVSRLSKRKPLRLTVARYALLLYEFSLKLGFDPDAVQITSPTPPIDQRPPATNTYENGIARVTRTSMLD